MIRLKQILVTLLLLLMGLPLSQALAQKEAKKIDEATGVLMDVMAIPEKGIPPVLLGNAHGIVIFPGVIKAAFVVGGRYGTGVMLARDEKGRWSAPVFLSIAGGSVGWQIGADSTDIILVLKSSRSVEGILKGKFTLGADAAVAAGPVGRSAEAATDVTMRSEILSYSRSRGLFAGVSLEGAALLMDADAAQSYYGKPVTPRDLLSGRFTWHSPEISRLHDALDTYAK